jgi:hypothetical protein
MESTSTPQDGEALFHAFRQEPKGRRQALLWALGLLCAGAVALGVALLSTRGEFHVVTRTGLGRLQLGMSREQVARVMGKPLAIAPSKEGEECLRYGTLRWKTFGMYAVCYAGGKLTSVEMKQYGMWRVGPDGTLTPFEEPPPPPKAQL